LVELKRAGQFDGGHALVVSPNGGGSRREPGYGPSALGQRAATRASQIIASSSGAGQSQIRFRFTPTDSSWLNQVEVWFAKI